MALPRRRGIVACAAALLLVLARQITLRDAFELVNWNVMFLFAGTLILADFFMQSRAPAWLAQAVVKKMRSARAAMLAICVLAGFLSISLENVAVVLLVAPVAFSVAEKLGVSPVRLLIAIAISSNLQGTATLIGDPPSMILAGHMKLSFNDFFVYQGRPGIFFAVQIGALASLLILAWLLRLRGKAPPTPAQERVESWVPSLFMLALIMALCVGSFVDREFKWFAGAASALLAGLATLWYRFFARWSPTRDVFLRRYDLDTTAFLLGVFVIAGALGSSGWIDFAARGLVAHLGPRLFYAFVGIVALSLLVSGFVDNVPFVLAMIPIVQKVAATMNCPTPLLMFGMLIGTCLGGNITPIGASANIVAVGMLRKRGYPVSFREFTAVGLPFTLAAVTSACAFVWWVWRA